MITPTLKVQMCVSSIFLISIVHTKSGYQFRVPSQGTCFYFFYFFFQVFSPNSNFYFLVYYFYFYFPYSRLDFYSLVSFNSFILRSCGELPPFLLFY